METTHATVTIEEGGKIILPHWIIKKVGLQIGDTLNITNLQGTIIARKSGDSPNTIDFFKELGRSLNASGYNTREKVQSIIDAVKMEVTEEWENKTHKP